MTLNPMQILGERGRRWGGREGEQAREREREGERERLPFYLYICFPFAHTHGDITTSLPNYGRHDKQ